MTCWLTSLRALTKRDKHTSGRKAKASGKRKKKAHKCGPSFFQKSLWVLKPKITSIRKKTRMYHGPFKNEVIAPIAKPYLALAIREYPY